MVFYILIVSPLLIVRLVLFFFSIYFFFCEIIKVFFFRPIIATFWKAQKTSAEISWDLSANPTF